MKPVKFSNLTYGRYADFVFCPSCNRKELVPHAVVFCPKCGEELQWCDDENDIYELTADTDAELVEATITDDDKLRDK